ncbi:MAG: hypothetical protein COB67_08710 [SAR324 cluster bacterium]|uniref:Uncharacterized protein n=1 Tax=SAR324 cluster bacterium TaxID=2024889 RepID=A0A2A4T244_9DELT|nr:MAG: hypothetical protein COB67_08710 [SAR324 cluster bacterium]
MWGLGNRAILLLGNQAIKLSLYGAAGTIATLNSGKLLQKMKPGIVVTMKESMAFKDWFMGKVDSLKEDVEDITAESLHEYYKELETSSEALAKEKEIWSKLEALIAQKSAPVETTTPKKKGK